MAGVGSRPLTRCDKKIKSMCTNDKIWTNKVNAMPTFNNRPAPTTRPLATGLIKPHMVTEIHYMQHFTIKFHVKCYYARTKTDGQYTWNLLLDKVMMGLARSSRGTTVSHHCRRGQRSRSSYSLQVGRSGVRIPVAERSKARDCGRSLAAVAGSNPTGGMDVCVMCCRTKRQNTGQSREITDEVQSTREYKKTPGGAENFRTRPDRPWGPPSLLYNGYRKLGGKAVGD